MKNQVLSIEQMKHLKELGVDVSKASMVLLFSDEYGECVRWEVENHGKDQPLYEFYDEEVEHWISTTAEYFDSDTGNYDHSYRESYGVFTLQDMLELLPNFISKDGYIYDLTSDMHNSIAYKIDWDNLEDDSLIDVDDLYLHTESDGSNLLKMAFKMLCWLAENEHLTKKEEEEEKEACHVCGKTDVELSECECCGELFCDDCSSIYNQFTQIDYNCCKPCSERERE